MIRNVVIVNDFDYVQGGASKVAIQTANILAQNTDLNIYFFCGDFCVENCLNDSVICVRTNSQEALKCSNRIEGVVKGLYNSNAEKDLKRLLSTLRIEETIVHIHGWTKVLSSSVFKACFSMKVKTILTIHDYFSYCPNGGLYNFKRHCKCHYKPLSFSCVTCDCDSRNIFFKWYRLLRIFIQNKIIKVPMELKNIIYISKFSEQKLKGCFNESAQKFYIKNPVDIEPNKFLSHGEYYLFVGRVCYEKGTDLFCSVMHKIKKKAIVIGDGPLLEKLKNQYCDIEFIGWKDEEVVNEYMRNAKALIFTSDWYETMGLTVVEAQLHGIPVFVRSDTSAVEFSNYPDYIFSSEQDLLEKIQLFESINVLPKIDSDYSCYKPSVYIKKLINAYNKSI